MCLLLQWQPDGDEGVSCCAAAEKVAEAEEEAEDAERQQKKPGREVSFFCIDYPGLVDAAQLRVNKLLQGLKDRIQDKYALFEKSTLDGPTSRTLKSDMLN